MIIVAGTIDVAPDQRDAYLESRKEAMLTARAEEGCSEFAFSADIVDPGRVRLFEIWESPEALEAHLAPMRAAGNAPGAIPVVDRSVLLYDISSVGPVPR
jgi:quinol monooxygenase YgiN